MIARLICLAYRALDWVNDRAYPTAVQVEGYAEVLS